MFGCSSEARIWRSRRKRASQFGMDVALDDLDGDALSVLVVGACRFVHRPHAAHADQAHDGVRADPFTYQ